MEDCPSYPYWTVSDGVQQALFLGCYAEAPRGPRICPGSTYLGLSSGDFEPDGKGLFGTIIPGGSTWPMRLDKQMGVGLDRMSLYVGSNPGSGVDSLIGWRAEGLAAIDHTENYGIVFSSARGAWQLRRHGYTYDFAVPFEIVGYGNERFPTQFGVPNLLIRWDNRRVKLTTGRVGRAALQLHLSVPTQRVRLRGPDDGHDWRHATRVADQLRRHRRGRRRYVEVRRERPPRPFSRRALRRAGWT